jgi:cytochrome c-type biogenesis protein
MPLAVIHADALGLAVAFAAGFVSFASPCVWPIVPAYLSFVSGVAFSEVEEQTGRVVAATACFVLGFSAVFVLGGVGAGVLGGELTRHRRGLEIVAGVLVVVMGLVMLGVAGTGFLQRERRFHLRNRPAGLGGAAVAGVAFAVGWTPCIGPTLTAIIGVAGESGHAASGALLLAAYSAGLGVPFLLAGMFFSRYVSGIAPLRRHSGTMMRVAGALLIVTGLFLASGELTTLTRSLAGWSFAT